MYKSIISIRAIKSDGFIRYSVVDDAGSDYTFIPKETKKPLLKEKLYFQM